METEIRVKTCRFCEYFDGDNCGACAWFAAKEEKKSPDDDACSWFIFMRDVSQCRKRMSMKNKEVPKQKRSLEF